MGVKIKIMRNCEASMFVHSKTLDILQAAQIQYYNLCIKQLLGGYILDILKWIRVTSA